MLYLILCVQDIVAAARACWSIIPTAIFGLLQTFLLTTYVRQWYLLNTWLPLFYLPSSCCTWYYVSGTLLLRTEHAEALFPWLYLDSCRPFCSQHMSSNDSCLIHDYHCFTCPAHVVLGTMCPGHCCHGQSMLEHYSHSHIWTPVDLSSQNRCPATIHIFIIHQCHGTPMICILCWSCSAAVL